jgi:hypothetical protein
MMPAVWRGTEVPRRERLWLELEVGELRYSPNSSPTGCRSSTLSQMALAVIIIGTARIVAQTPQTN